MQNIFYINNFLLRKFFCHILILGFLGSFWGCAKKLVDTSYATLNQKSINGIDALRGLLKQRAQSYLETSYLTRRVRQEADLVVFVEKSPFLYPGRFFAQFESWLTGQPLPEEEELLEKPDSVQSFPEPLAKRNRLALAFRAATDSRQDGRQGRNRNWQWQKKDLLSSIAEKKKTFLYFIKDTRADLPFFERVYNDLQGYARQQNYIRHFLERSRELRESPSFVGELPFGQRFLSRKGGPLLHSSELLWEREVFAKGVAYFPVRMVPSPPVLNYVQKVPLRFHLLLSTKRGEVLIREFFFPKVRLILIYNTEPFLNYSLVRRPYQRLAADLLDYALSKGEARRKTIALIRKLPVPPLHAKADREEGLSRIFFVYPVNLWIVSFMAFLLFFLLSQWPHKRRPLAVPKRGSRTFLEHFRALGVHLSRSRDKEDVLESLLAFKKTRMSHASRRRGKAKDTKGKPKKKNTFYDS